uniref:GST N-terminal domain-containing protein n=2 Tax=Aegilops tauschii subsp. strangulata TaxID=200361 RepID=A0A453QHJ5_AEGTS
CARGSPKRQEIFKKLGLFQVPYIEDPNTGVKMFESAEIVEYLRATYTLYPQYQNL